MSTSPLRASSHSLICAYGKHDTDRPCPRLSFVGLLIYSSVIFHRFRKGNLTRGDEKIYSVQMATSYPMNTSSNNPQV